MNPSPKSAEASIYSVPLKSIEGKDANLSSYKGKALLIVNTASRCGYTPQYQGLQALHEKYAAKGFEVLGFPSNDFGAQEPGTESEIKNFCELNYKVSFPLYSKVRVTGPEKHPLYKLLTETAPQKGEVGWNFEKFLIDRQGKVVGRYPSKVAPESAQLVKDIEAAL